MKTPERLFSKPYRIFYVDAQEETRTIFAIGLSVFFHDIFYIIAAVDYIIYTTKKSFLHSRSN